MKKRILTFMLIAALAAALAACQKAPAEDTGSGEGAAPSTQQPADTAGAEEGENAEAVLEEKIYGEAAFAISIDENQWLDASGTGYGWYIYQGTGEEVETFIIQDGRWTEGVTNVEDVPAIVDEQIDERLSERNAYLSYERSEDSQEKVTVNGVDMLRVTGTICLNASDDGTENISYDYIGYFFLANNSIGVRENCPSYLIALAKKSDFEDESYVYDQAVAEKNLSLIDEIIQTYKVY